MASPSADPRTAGLLTPEESKRFAAIQRSRTWRVLQDAMCQKREQLFSVKPKDNLEMAKTWGGIEALNDLLHQGPLLVVLYERHLAASAPSSPPPDPASGIIEDPPDTLGF